MMKQKNKKPLQARKCKIGSGKVAMLFVLIAVLIAIFGYGFWQVGVWQTDRESDTVQDSFIQKDAGVKQEQNEINNHQSQNAVDTVQEGKRQIPQKAQLQLSIQEKNKQTTSGKKTLILDSKSQKQIDLTNPIAYLNKNQDIQFMAPLDWSLDFSDVQRTKRQRLDSNKVNVGSPEPHQNDKTTLFDYIKVERCRENEKAPDYLDHKLNGESTSDKEAVADMLRLPSCGMIKTKIPLSF